MDLQRIRALYDAGKADGQIGRSVGLHHVVIRHWRERFGLKPNTTPRPAARISSSPWTEQRDNTAKAMWADGHSASEIAKALAIGVSRSAVIGRLNRLGVAGKLKARKTRARSSNRPAMAKPSAPRHVNHSPARQILREFPTLPLPPVDTMPPQVSFNKLEDHHCRAIVAEHMPFNADAKIYCGERKVLGTSWCECHLRRYAVALTAKSSTYKEPSPTMKAYGKPHVVFA